MLTPHRASASCEGTDATNLYGAWYNEAQGILVKEVGSESGVAVFKEFLVEQNGVTETVLAAEHLLPAFGAEFTRVELRILERSDNTPSIAFAEALRQLIKAKGLPKQIHDGTAESRAQTYIDDLEAVHNLLAEQPGFVALQKLATCPYRARRSARHSGSKYCVIETTSEGERPVGCLPDFPGDNRSETHVTPDAVCWGTGDKPKLVSFHWRWECQGEGDLASVITALK